MVLPIRDPYIFDDDTETSDEEEVKYTQVKIIPNPSGQSDTTDSSPSEDETQYSDVKLWFKTPSKILPETFIYIFDQIYIYGSISVQ